MDITVLLPEEFGTEETDLSFMENYNINYVLVTSINYAEVIEKIPKNNKIINLCDGVLETDEAGVNVIKELEKTKRHFIGTSSKKFLWLKSDIRQNNTECPQYILVNKTNVNNFDFDKINLKYPLFVKPNHYAGGSDGIIKESKVKNADELKIFVEKSLKIYDELIIEEYIDGKEFTVLVLQGKNKPIVLEPIECIFDNGYEFKDYDLKWYLFNHLSYKQVNDNEIYNNLVKFSEDIFIKLELDGYVRFDIRMDQNKKLYLLDVNPYCGIFYPKEQYGSADFILENSKIMNHKEFVEYSFDVSKNRYDMNV
jgi:D-alanine-D-alanine ligase